MLAVRLARQGALILFVLIAGGRLAAAQPLGIFRWQLQPFCNVVTLTVTQTGASYTLDGFDDLCGAATRASATGIAFPNPNGTIGLGLTLVVAPDAAPIHVDAVIDLATISGTWHDSVGHTGALVFNPAAPTGTPRPAPVAGTVVPASRFTFLTDGGFAARGEDGIGTLRATGAGTRLVWHPAKGAFRVGRVTGTQWDDANIGSYSVALGADAVASGTGSIALGLDATASNTASVAMGADTTASGAYSVALGLDTTASAVGSVAMGRDTIASGAYSTALGFKTVAGGSFSVSMGSRASSGHPGTFVFGDASTGASVVATAANQFIMRVAGGARFFSNSLMNMGVYLAPNGGAWTQISDAARKRNFRDLDGEDVLGKLRAMPIREWSYRAQDPGIRHVGPTAQDFRAAFGLGEDPLGITTIDADGIALRAIQALEARTHALREENARLTAENESLRRAIEEIRSSVAAIRSGARR